MIVLPIEGDDGHISLKKPRGDVALAADESILGRDAGLGFRALDDGDTIEFTGKAYMKIYPKQKNQEGQGG